MLLGLVQPDARRRPPSPAGRYEQLPRPSAQVGAVLEDASFHPGRSGRNHLRVLAAAGGTSRRAGRRGARPGRPDRGGRPAREGLLDGDAPAPGHRRRAARRPRGADPRRAHQRPRPARASAGCATCCARRPAAAGPCSCPATCWPRWPRAWTTSWSSRTAVLRASGPLEQVLGGAEGRSPRVRAADNERLAAALRERGIGVERDGTGGADGAGRRPRWSARWPPSTAWR